MKVAIASDVHLEFGPLELTNEQNADVLILSGDIMVAADLLNDGKGDPYGIIDTAKHSLYQKFFEQCSAEFPHVVYVMGNHEHYHGDFAATTRTLRAFLKPFDNVHLLDKETFTVGDVTFIGGTLWTDMNKEDPLTIHSIRSMMNDFRCVDNGNREATFRVFNPKDKPVGMSDEEWVQLPIEARQTVEFKTRKARFSPEDAVEEHRKMLQYIQTIVEGKHDQKFVVVGHHAPSRTSTHPRYSSQELMNGGYSSSLDEYILDHPQIKLWTHGHTHDIYDYMIGTTRVVCNPRGYINYEDRADQFELKYVEV